jgi:hypothetical protein
MGVIIVVSVVVGEKLVQTGRHNDRDESRSANVLRTMTV